LGVPVRAIVTTGGGARSALWRAIQAGVHGVPVRYYPAGDPPADSSALGAAIIAGTAVGMFSSLETGADLVRSPEAHVSEPDPAEAAAYQATFARYLRVAQQLAPLEPTP
jgi:sugar (pentulose or hexulose) kinase